MYRQTVTLDPAKPNFPLTPLFVGQGSAAVVILSDVPAGASAALIITPVGGGTPVAYAAAANAATGDLEVYAAGWAFPTAGTTKYEITFTTGEGDTERTFWAGSGLLHVMTAATVADIPNAPVLPQDTYVRSPVTGLYYLVTVELNELGEPVLTTASEGVEHV